MTKSASVKLHNSPPSTPDFFRQLGANPAIRGGKSGWLFRLWAPDTPAVSVAGDFNGWSPSATPMEQTGTGLWERFLPSQRRGTSINMYSTGRMDPINTTATLAPFPLSRRLARLPDCLTSPVTTGRMTTGCVFAVRQMLPCGPSFSTIYRFTPGGEPAMDTRSLSET